MTQIMISSLICLMTVSLTTQTTNICDLEATDEDIDVVSVFSLGDSLLVQIQVPNSKNTTIWQVMNTEPTDKLKPWDISPKMKDHHFILPDFFGNLSQTGITETMRVTGHSIDPQILNTLNVCPFFFIPNVTQTQEDCLELQRMKTGYKLVCLYGHEINVTTNVTDQILVTEGFIFYSHPIGHFVRLSERIRKEVTKRCETGVDINPIDTKNAISTLTNYYWLPEPHWTRLAVVPKSINNSDVIYFDGSVIRHKFVNPREVNFAFKYNNKLPLLACPRKCTLRGPIFHISTEISSLIINRMRVSLAQLLGCVQKIKRFFPNNFCAKDPQFISIFNLGDHLFFQKSGLFLRYSPDMFRKPSNNKGFNIVPMIIDSDFTEFLERQGFDTDFPIRGFAFKGPDQGRCDEGDEQCLEELVAPNQYFRVCIIGSYIRQATSELIRESLWKVYRYTPYGIVEFKMGELRLNYDICKETYLKLVGSSSEERAKNYLVAANSKWVGETHSLYGLIREKTGDNDNPSLKYFMKKVVWDRNTAKLKTDWLQVTESNKVPEDQHLGSIRGMFEHFWGKPKFYGVLNGKTFISWLPTDVKSGVNPDIQPTRGNLFNEFDCPFNQSATLLKPRHRTKVCDNTDHYQHHESVFTVGTHLIHQIGQHFYEYNEEKRRFYYNRHITNVLNYYFG